MKEKNLLLVDSIKSYLESESAYIRHYGFKVFTADSKYEALDILHNQIIDLLIIDVRLTNKADEEDVSGLDFAESLNPEIPKIIISSFPDYRTVRKALSFRVIGYPIAVNFISKLEGHEALITAIKAALSDEIGYQRMIRSAFKSRLVLDNENLTLKIGGKMIYVTPQEYNVLKYLYDNKNSVVSRNDIVVYALKEEPFLADCENQRINNLIYRIRKKIVKEIGETDIIETIQGGGYRMNI